ncbi:hypothetical protein X975_12624, partial [Stegodyphus mimosarum]
MGVDSFVVNLSGGVSIAIAISSHVPRSTDVMVADGFPPDNRLGFAHLLDVFVNSGRIHLIGELKSGGAVPTLHQVDKVKHGHKSDRYEDVTVLARAGCATGGDGKALEIDDKARHTRALAPGEGC